MPGFIKGNTAKDGTGTEYYLVCDANGVMTVTLAAGTAAIGAVDITKVAGAAIAQGHGTAAAAIRVELPTDGTGVVGLGTGTASIGGAKDNGPHWTSVFGVSGARYTSADRSASAAAVTDAPTSGQKLVVTDVLVSVDTAMRVDLKEETSGTVLASIYLPAGGTYQWTPRSKTKLATADKKLTVQTSVAGNIAVTAHYYSEA